MASSIRLAGSSPTMQAQPMDNSPIDLQEGNNHVPKNALAGMKRFREEEIAPLDARRVTKTISTQPFKTVHEPGMGKLEIFPLSIKEEFLRSMLSEIFSNYWDQIDFGILNQGGVYEITPQSAPTKIGFLDGYLTVHYPGAHTHVCLGETKGLYCEPTSEEVSNHRRPSRAELYRKLNTFGQPTFWGLRIFNGHGEQTLTIFLPNPFLTKEPQKLNGKAVIIDGKPVMEDVYAKTPDFTKLALWNHLRKQYLGLESDPKDMTAKRFSHD